MEDIVNVLSLTSDKKNTDFVEDGEAVDTSLRLVVLGEIKWKAEVTFRSATERKGIPNRGGRERSKLNGHRWIIGFLYFLFRTLDTLDTIDFLFIYAFGFD